MGAAMALASEVSAQSGVRSEEISPPRGQSGVKAPAAPGEEGRDTGPGPSQSAVSTIPPPAGQSGSDNGAAVRPPPDTEAPVGGVSTEVPVTQGTVASQPAGASSDPVAVPGSAVALAPPPTAPPSTTPGRASARAEPLSQVRATASGEVPCKFARSGHFAIGVERLMGYFHSRGEVDLDRGEYYVHLDEKNTFFSVLTPANSEYGAEIAAVPRVTADYFVLDQLSVGVDLGYATHSGEFDVRSNIQTSGSAELNDFDLYLAGARVGFMSLLMDSLGVWPRVGYQYSHWSYETPSGGIKSSGALHTMDFEALLVLLPSASWGVHAGVVVDLSVAGTQTDVTERRRTRFDVRRRTVGLTAGLTGII